METLKTSKTLIEGLQNCNQQDGTAEKGKCVVQTGYTDSTKLVNGCNPFDSSNYIGVPIKGISLFVELTGGMMNKSDENFGQHEFIANSGSGVMKKPEKNVGQQEFEVNVGGLVRNTSDKNVGQQEFEVNIGSGVRNESDKNVGQQEFVVNVGGLVVNESDESVGRQEFEVNIGGGVMKKPDENVGRQEFEVNVGGQVTNTSTENVGQQELVVNIGDFVWAKLENVKKQWWPGIVCEASTAPKKVAKLPKKEDDILVQCFGNRTYIWCSPYHIKPFVGYFDELHNHSKAVKYFDALEMAVTELGHHVRTEFTCSCFSKMPVKKKTRNFGDLSVTRLNPVKFLDYIKDLARDINKPNRIDYVFTQKCLSAFYSSLGHLQVLINPEEDVGKSENPNESKERKKSGFLSYSGEQRQPVKMLKKRGRKRKNVSSSEVISQLHFAAQDCVLPYKSKNFDLVKQFITEFRKWVFNDFSKESPVKLPNYEILQETLPKKVKKKKGKSAISKTGQDSLNHGSVFIDFQNISSPVLEPRSMANNVADRNPIFGFGNVPVVTGPVTNGAGSSPPLVTGQPHEGPVPTGLNSNHEPKKKGQKRKTADSPNVNENGTEMKKEKRSKKSIETKGSCIDLSYNKVQPDNEQEVKGTAFLLKFSPDHPFPSPLDLNLFFSKYGALIESETQIFNEKCSGQVVFLDSASAGGAFSGLHNDRPFGSALVNYRIQHLSDIDTKVRYKAAIKPIKPTVNGNSNEVKVVKISKTVEEIRLPAVTKLPPRPGDLAGIKRNLDMMKLMLQKDGDCLLPEIRVKLESEIKGLMNKVTAMDCGSSSSSL